MTHADYCKQFIPSGGKVLDVGSGKGEFLCTAAAMGFESYGLEPSHEYIKLACQKAEEKNLKINVEEGGAEKLPYPDDFFDFVNCSEVTEHIENPEEALCEIFRVLKQGGKCYLSFHNRWGVYDYHYHLYLINWMPRSWGEKIIYALGKQKQDGVYGRQRLSTMHYFSFKRAKSIVKKARFSFEDIRAEKIRGEFGASSVFILATYYLVLRPFYFNTFHFLLTKYS